MEKLYSCQEVAQRYGVQKRTVWEWIRTGKLAAVSVGGVYRVYPSALKDFEKPTKIETEA